MICLSWSLLTPDRIFARLTGTPSPTKSNWQRRARRVPTRIDLLVPSLCTLWATNTLSMVKTRKVWDSTAICGDPGLPATHTAEQLILVVSMDRSDYVWKRWMRNSPCIGLSYVRVAETMWPSLSHPGNLTKSNSNDLWSSPVSTPELRSNKSLYQESDIPLNH